MPNNVLQPVWPAGGLENLWTPQVVADWLGCEPSCNNRGQVCPTGAIRALPVEEKRAARIRLAEVNRATCLTYAGRQECRACADACRAAGYDAIEFLRVHVETDSDGHPLKGTGFVAPVVLAERCNGRGLCQTRCRRINVESLGLLVESARVVKAGPGKEDRPVSGSYLAIRQAEEERRSSQQRGHGETDSYLPNFLK